MIDEILSDLNKRMQQAIVHVQTELNKVRTGRANPEMFNSLWWIIMEPLLLLIKFLLFLFQNQD